MHASGRSPLTHPPLRRDIARALFQEAYGGRPTVAGQLVAMAFAQRLIDARDGGGFLQLSLWAEQTCERYGTFPDIAALLRMACPVARSVLRAQRLTSASLDNDLFALDATIASKLATIGVTAAHETPEPSDGVDGTIASLLVKLDENDPLSAEHSRAVSLWCRRLARKLGLSEERSLFLARAGLLHDLGKTTTPKDILLAPRALTEEEFSIVRDHPSAGAAMVWEFERLRPFVPVIARHHERLDGKGYPGRLGPSEISVEVRVVTVADCFNAMIGRRPYRPPMTPALALDQLLAHSGTQFDPQIVDAMIDIVEHPDD